MSNFINNSPFLRTSREYPEDPLQLTQEVNKSYVDIAGAVNNRTIGLFPINKPAINGESWFLTQNLRQQGLRQVYTFGAITAGHEKDIVINIPNFNQFTRIYGTVITAVPDYRPLPYIDPGTLTTGIALLVGTVTGQLNVRIVVGSTSPNITSGIVILEWISQP